MNRKFWLLAGTTIVSFPFAGHAVAHAMLERSTPANHAVLGTAPKTIDLKFGHATKLTKLKLLSVGQEIPLTVDLAAPASTTFSLPLPALKPGIYKVKWSTLSGDGHAMTGSLSFTVGH